MCKSRFQQRRQTEAAVALIPPSGSGSALSKKIRSKPKKYTTQHWEAINF
jgi:hypothetical protein